MKYSLFNSSDAQEVIELFINVFSESESESEGKLIGNLVSELIKKTNTKDLIGFIATSDESIEGCIFFSRLIVPNNEVAFILSPVAIATSIQRTGIGQKLINYGLAHLQTLSVNLIFTYGDPKYYAKTGFRQISESIVKAPCELSQPEGWLVQSLNGEPVKAMQGATKCVDALNDKKYW